MSGCSLSNCAISRVISTASLPCTGTGKNRSMSVAACAAEDKLIAAAIVIPATIVIPANAGTQRRQECSRLRGNDENEKRMTFPLFDSGKREAGDELPLEGQEDRQQRGSDEEGAGGNNAPFRSRFGARGE